MDYFLSAWKLFAHTNAEIFETAHFLHELAFGLRQTSETSHRGRIILKPISRMALRLGLHESAAGFL